MIRRLSINSTQSLQNQLKVCKCFHSSNKVSSEITAKGRSFQKVDETEKKKLSPLALSLLVVPIGSFGLGVWQIQRKKWKEGLIADLQTRRNQTPVPLPKNFDELKDMEYFPVHIKGKFHHDKEMYMGPKSLIIRGGRGNLSSGLFSQSKSGYHVVTPFELSGSGKIILVNRGWVPAERIQSASYVPEQSSAETEIVGYIRHSEKQHPLGMKNLSHSNIWLYRDVQKMAQVANTEPVFIEADSSSTTPGGPIGGQTRFTLRNEHLSYIITWFGLSLTSAGFWYLKYIRNIGMV